MSVIYGGSNPSHPTTVKYADSGGLDSFGRVRVLFLIAIFDAQQTYNMHPLLFETTVSSKLPMRYPITLDSAGNIRSLGTLTLLVSGIGGASQTYGSFNWKEIR